MLNASLNTPLNTPLNTQKKTNLYILIGSLLFIFIIAIFYYYKSKTPSGTPSGTTKTPYGTPISTPISTPVPTLNDAFEGNWVSYIVYGTEYGPVNIVKIGQNKYNIEGENLLFNQLKLLTIDPNTLICSLPEYGSFGKALVIDGKAVLTEDIEDVYNKPITLKRFTKTPLPTPSPTTTDPFEGIWVSYKVPEYGELGPISIMSSGQPNKYYIYGENKIINILRILTVDPNTLLCSLPAYNTENVLKSKGVDPNKIIRGADYGNKINFGKALIVNGKAILIEDIEKEQYNSTTTLKRFTKNPLPTPSPTTTDPFEGIWTSFHVSGFDGPISIMSSGQPNKYYIYSEGGLYTYLRIMTVDPNTLYCSFPYYGDNRFQNLRSIILNGKAQIIGGDQSINIIRSNEILTASTTTDPFEGPWVSYNNGGDECGPISIIKTGLNEYYIIGGKYKNGNDIPYSTRVLTVDANTLECSLPKQSEYNFGKAIIYKGKAVLTKPLNYYTYYNFRRSNDLPEPVTTTDPFEGNWVSFKWHGMDFGKVFILPTGPNEYYIYGGNMEMLTYGNKTITFDPNTLSCNIGKVNIINGKAMSIDGPYATLIRTDKTSIPTTPIPTTPIPTTPIPTTPIPTTPIPTTPIPTASLTTTDAVEGIWDSYKLGENEFGPVSIVSTGPNEYYIYGGSTELNKEFRVLTFNRTTSLFSLPNKYNGNNFGQPYSLNNKLYLIKGNDITLARSFNVTVTPSPISTDPFEGLWVDYVFRGVQMGPVTIMPIGQDQYYILGGNISDFRNRFMNIRNTGPPFNKKICSLPQLGIDLGKTTFVNEKAVGINIDPIAYDNFLRRYN
jgi:hypothetical protein